MRVIMRDHTELFFHLVFLLDKYDIMH